ncbi:hypothetical protein AB0M36_17730 [Actinoplanes sp. NPDC051346]|uniref:hypothetical protein n=1 Tax=Actinoplanes sp. NPDC051346 TaxID=3155048 RepID=UPI00341FB67F
MIIGTAVYVPTRAQVVLYAVTCPKWDRSTWSRTPRYRSKKVALGVLGAAGGYWVGCKLFTWVLAKIPGVGMVTGSGINGMLNAGFTLWLAYSFIDLFEEDDIDLTDWEFLITQLKGAMRPSMSSGKFRRIRAFFGRFDVMGG